MPTGQQRRDVLKRAKVCVSISNWVDALEVSGSHRFFECEIGDALAQGCVPVVYTRGAESELCGLLGTKFAFDRVDDLEEQISLAARWAEEQKEFSSHSMETLSLDRFYGEWDRVLS
jgi:hypothetical protein